MLTAVVVAVALYGAGQVRVGQRPSQPAPTEMSPSAARQAIMAAEDRRYPLPDDLRTPAIDTWRGLQADDVLLLARLARTSKDARTRDLAIRALGRYERRELTPELQQIMAAQDMNPETMIAVANSLRGPPLALDMSEDQIGRFFRREYLGGVDPNLGLWWMSLGTLSRSIARLPYTNVPQVEKADRFFVDSIVSVYGTRNEGRIAEIAMAAESRARLHAKFGTLNDDLVTWLRKMATQIPRKMPGQLEAMEALVATQGVDEDTLRRAVRVDERGSMHPMHRLAALVISGSGSPLAPAERTDTIITLMKDSDALVRIEAVRAWARREAPTEGCQRLLDQTRIDQSVPVILVILDLLGDACRTDINVTDLLTVEARNPPPNEWQRPSHALISLAKRAPDRATIAMPSHLGSSTWQVRMYAARAAAILRDTPMLERLAWDPVDNVREAALPALRTLKKAESDVYFLAALNRSDYQLIRTASRTLKGATSTPELAGALGDALRRITADKKETSRDVRLELLERLRELGGEDQAGAVEPLLRDFDIEVAQSAGATLTKWTGKPQEVAPAPLARPPLPTDGEIAEASTLVARVRMSNGKHFRIRLLPLTAPLNAIRFMRLAKAGYYDGLTFHRVVPNFVVQGGSSGANEYVGDGPFVHDEIGQRPHSAGSVGMSTRGRDTGDGQFFINLVSNPRLDYEYTVFGDVVDGNMEIADILEGDVIQSIVFEKETEDKDKGGGAAAGGSIR